jgi:hypothetical protein
VAGVKNFHRACFSIKDARRVKRPAHKGFSVSRKP